MNYPVVLRRKSTEEFVAEPLGKPELEVIGATEEEALEQVGQALGRWMGSGRLVAVEVPGGGDSPNPWLEAWGSSAEDPDYEEFAAELQKARASRI